MSESRIMKCGCKHDYQDKKHGKGKRVHNKTADNPPRWRCTACGFEKGA